MELGIDLLGYVAGILVLISLLPQIIKSWQTRSTKDISLARYVIYVIGLILWFSYAVLIDNGPLKLMSGIEAILAGTVLYLKLRYG